MYIGDRVQIIDPAAPQYGEFGTVMDCGFDWVYVDFGSYKGYEYNIWQVESVMAIKAIKNMRPWRV